MKDSEIRAIAKKHHTLHKEDTTPPVHMANNYSHFTNAISEALEQIPHSMKDSDIREFIVDWTRISGAASDRDSAAMDQVIDALNDLLPPEPKPASIFDQVKWKNGDEHLVHESERDKWQRGIHAVCTAYLSNNRLGKSEDVHGRSYRGVVEKFGLDLMVKDYFDGNSWRLPE